MYTVGRSKDRDLTVPFTDVSEAHATIQVSLKGDRHTVRITDTSSNGTTVYRPADEVNRTRLIKTSREFKLDEPLAIKFRTARGTYVLQNNSMPLNTGDIGGGTALEIMTRYMGRLLAMPGYVPRKPLRTGSLVRGQIAVHLDNSGSLAEWVMFFMVHPGAGLDAPAIPVYRDTAAGGDTFWVKGRDRKPKYADWVIFESLTAVILRRLSFAAFGVCNVSPYCLSVDTEMDAVMTTDWQGKLPRALVSRPESLAALRACTGYVSGGVLGDPNSPLSIAFARACSAPSFARWNKYPIAQYQNKVNGCAYDAKFSTWFKSSRGSSEDLMLWIHGHYPIEAKVGCTRGVAGAGRQAYGAEHKLYEDGVWTALYRELAMNYTDDISLNVLWALMKPEGRNPQGKSKYTAKYLTHLLKHAAARRGQTVEIPTGKEDLMSALETHDKSLYSRILLEWGETVDVANTMASWTAARAAWAAREALALSRQMERLNLSLKF